MPDEEKNAYWIERARTQVNEFAVSPGATSMTYERWSREKLQRWTVHQIARHARWDHVVDLGCGFGDFTAALGSRAQRVTACDVAPAFVEETRRRLAAVGHPDARVHVADIVSFDDFADATVVYLGAVLMYLDHDDALRVVRRVRERLAPGGVVAQRDWCVIGVGREKTLRHDGRYSLHRSPATYRRLFQEGGFRLIKKRISPYIYGQQMARDALRAEWLVAALGWLPQACWRLGTLHWRECSATFLYEPR